ncbi:hypothetical protein A0O34_00825 [Chryseobacterium glaciei]|uniref:Uncharacterized protein n=1 Tax=Chryseobacterium glaciei TaxID=1685010 RepID=A0A172XQI7_9FLAO|nr:hypothetical protein [Chryseobacterium glaciei]ANF49186.1 hypothetical protein A0O34_00825 [Chryseobacterium glaciei]
MQEDLIQIISEIPDTSDNKTEQIFSLSHSINKNGFLTKELGMKILNWKSPRPFKHYDKNTNADFETITKYALMQEDEKIKIHILTALNGVNYPSASAILMFSNPLKYPVIDIRVWRQLYKNQLVTENPKGQNFTLTQWAKYLEVIRQISNSLNITPRQVEKRLFDYDKSTQIGTLYISSKK